ncbi:MAG: hypothetical protein ACLSA6_18330 [Holdemania massiliensis]
MDKFYRIQPIYEERIWGYEDSGKFHYRRICTQEAYHVIAIPGHLDNLVEGENIPLSNLSTTSRLV